MTVQRILKELCDLANYIDENEIDSICNRFITAKEHNKNILNNVNLHIKSRFLSDIWIMHPAMSAMV